MTTRQAKEILLAYRPGVDDAQDPEVVAALAVVRASELERWFAEHYCKARRALRAKFRRLAVRTVAPADFVGTTVEHTDSVVASSCGGRSAGVCVIGIALASLWQTMKPVGGEDLSFNGYRQRMVRTTLRAYGMDLETNDVAQVQAFLGRRIARRRILNCLWRSRRTPTVGCGVLSWQGKPGDDGLLSHGPTTGAGQ